MAQAMSKIKPMILIMFQAVCLNVLLGCNRIPSQSIRTEANKPVDAVLVVNPFSPYEYKKLLSNPVDSYGAAKHTGSEGVEGDYVYWNEYIGVHGRIRVYEETRNDGENGWSIGNWLILYPGKLYLEDVLSKEYLKTVRLKNGKWTLYVMNGENPTWFLTLTLNNAAIVEAYYSERESMTTLR